MLFFLKEKRITRRKQATATISIDENLLAIVSQAIYTMFVLLTSWASVIVPSSVSRSVRALQNTMSSFLAKPARAPCSPVLSRGRGPATAPSAGTGSGDAAPLPSSPPPETHSQTPRDVTYTWTLVKNRPSEPTNRNESQLLDTEKRRTTARGEARRRRRSWGEEVGGANPQLPREHPRYTHGASAQHREAARDGVRTLHEDRLSVV